ncbi:hypothetical protein OPV22_025482 [Ensete ventricosum]|uniref:Uncharacterized protein n=1 Tax=Ensete ventricosum TaxID=4639 RepID=A0AAV8QJC5_ENSVE|nr:hypothetical protein OPV22_025482 [Ensete ventricosum]
MKSTNGPKPHAYLLRRKEKGEGTAEGCSAAISWVVLSAVDALNPSPQVGVVLSRAASAHGVCPPSAASCTGDFRFQG